MRFTEIDVFGVYVAPMSLMMVAACAGLRAASVCCVMFGIRHKGSLSRHEVTGAHFGFTSQFIIQPPMGACHCPRSGRLRWRESSRAASAVRTADAMTMTSVPEWDR